MPKNLILIVDDNPHAVSLVSIVLSRKMDCELAVAFDGSTAIKQAREKNPDLILMDWQMPGIDGIRAIEILKEDPATASIPVIMITCYSEKDYLEKAFNAGVIDFIRKPFDNLELLVRVKSVLTTRDYYNQMIEAQKRESVALSMQNVQSEEFRHKCIAALKQLKSLYKTEPENTVANIDKIIGDLDTELSSSSWNQIEKRIKDTDQQFFKSLSEKHPNLTPSEMKLCLYLRMNLSTKEIASATYQTYDSVRIARTRLRKKLNLTNDDNLVGYISSF
ncbi:MAG: response regulator [Bacteroidota bacterium]|nr:response regulator [Bacteroidota bacterium]